jgi:thiol:disulfide interchange protein DsbD
MRLVASLLALILAALPAAAQSVAVTDHARSALHAETIGVAPGGAVRLALHQILEPGWHVYWKNPGDSGLPLETIWTLPDGVAASEVDYPAPERIEIGPLVNFGHHGEPVFVMTLTAPASAAIGSAIDVGLEATWLICAEICVPETGSFSLSIPVVAVPAPDASAAATFLAAAAQRPTAADARFKIANGVLAIEASGIEGDGAYFFPEADDLVAPTAPQRFVRRGEAIRLSAPALKDEKPAPLNGVLLVTAGGEEARYAIAAAADPAIEIAPLAEGSRAAAPPPAGSLPGLLLAAFIGGAILNLMPCVFPILFVKAAAIAAAGAEPRQMRRHGLLYGAGAIVTFAALGATLLALRAAGAGLGWGFHLQSPAVVALSAYVLFVVGLNLVGAFSIGAGLQNVGSGLVSSATDDLAAFLTGVLAVFVAAPCVGPFLTAPVGAAALLAPAGGMAIFVAMALGLAAPYVALSYSPALARRLPRPGPWMERFRQALAFPVFAASAYFLWVLSAQTGRGGLALALGGLVLIAFATRAWEWGRNARWGRPAAALTLLAAAISLALLRPAPAVAAQSGYAGTETIAFDAADIERRRAAGEAIFIDFTAAWCVTCQVNKLAVLSSKKIAAAFDAADVTFAVADWTNRDASIEQALAGFGANGVPLYVFYPSGGEAVVLAQPLTQSAILALVTAEDAGGSGD